MIKEWVGTGAVRLKGLLPAGEPSPEKPVITVSHYMTVTWLRDDVPHLSQGEAGRGSQPNINIVTNCSKASRESQMLKYFG